MSSEAEAGLLFILRSFIGVVCVNYLILNKGGAGCG